VGETGSVDMRMSCGKKIHGSMARAVATSECFDRKNVSQNEKKTHFWRHLHCAYGARYNAPN
jgi:hypothetical protein